MKFLFAAPTFLCVTALVVFDAGAMSMPVARPAGSSSSLASIQDGAQASSFVGNQRAVQTPQATLLSP
jgi:hypothetical protein